jgi:Flp pilus assembly protein TadD
MKLTSAALALLLLCSASFAQDHHASAADKPIALLPGMGNLHHPISTTNPEAQRYFDQGLTLVYGFNHEDAIRSFRRAAELDPKAPMPWWGIALALGPNYNVDVDPDREKAAYDAIQKAQSLATNAPANEHAYIVTLAARYTNDPKPDYHQLTLAYRDAMKKLAQQYPDDPDAGTMYAESMMVVRPWQLWTLDGKPAEGTEAIVVQLETVLRAYPNHVGANHYYIHAVEASPNPERAFPSAERLQTLVPDAGHLVHMPSHIYQRTGDFDKAAAANVAAIKADRGYVERTNTQGSMYDMMYFTHNLHFLVMACSMQGNSKCAIDTANDMAKHVAPGVKEMNMLEWFLAWQPFTLVRFHQWNEILALPAPDPSLTMDSAAYHYARGMAFLAKGDKQQAQAERKAVAAIIDKTPEEAPYGLNHAKPVLLVAAAVLDGKIAAANGDKTAAADFYRKAIAQQDQLNYDEPQDWYYPVRETLGAALFNDGDAAGAEAVFRADLERNPRNGRSLYGLSKALEAQKKATEAAWVQSQFKVAWAQADVQPNLAEY